jgi:hypothetical protein
MENYVGTQPKKHQPLQEDSAIALPLLNDG